MTQAAPNYLQLIHNKANLKDGLAYDPISLNYGLVALRMVLDNNGHITTDYAANTLIEKLGLDLFIKNHPKYLTSKRAAISLLIGLIKKGFMTRWTCSPRKEHSRFGSRTKGYIITPDGIARYEEIKKTIPKDLLISVPELNINEIKSEPKEAQFNLIQLQPDEVVVNFNDIKKDGLVSCSLISPQDIDVVSPLSNVTKNLDQIQPLLDEHDKLSKSIDSINLEINSLRTKWSQNFRTLISTIKEIKEFHSLRAGEQEALNAVMAKLKKLVNS